MTKRNTPWARAAGPFVPFALCVAAVLCGTGPAEAASSSASISNIEFQARDLTPNDGQAAGFEFADAFSTLRTDVRWAGQDASSDRMVPGWLSPRSLDVAAGGVHSTGVIGPAGLFASGQTTEQQSDYLSYLTAWVQEPNNVRAGGLRIAPHTEVLVSADWDLFAAAPSPCNPDDCNRASGFVGISAFDGGTFLFNRQFTVDTTTAPAGTNSLHKSGAVSFSLLNDSDDWKSDQLVFIADASGSWAPLPQAPEPASWMLAGAGLAALALLRRGGRRRKEKASAAVLGLLGLAAALPGMAQAAQTATASASITDIRFQARDLDPNDGQPADYRLPEPFSAARSGARRGSGALQESFNAARQIPGWLAPVDAQTDLPGVSSSAAVRSTGFSATGQAGGELTQFTADAAGSIGEGTSEFTLVVAPHTALTMSADWQLMAAVSAPCATLSSCPRAGATVHFGWMGDLAPGDLVPSGNKTFSVQTDVADAQPQSVHDSGVFTFTLTNNTDSWRGVNILSFDAGVWGDGPLPIPEPASAALLASGLLGLALRRGTRRRAPRGAD